MAGGERPAEALLAGVELGDGVGSAGEVLRVGVKGVDGVFGGIKGGRVVGVSGEGADVCRRMLVASLLEVPGSMAAVVDTTGNFDVVKVYTGIVERLKMEPDLLVKSRAAIDAKEEEKVEDVAAKVLDHVKIMRVFDFVGMREAVGEVRNGLEGRGQKEEEVQEEAATEILNTEPLPKRTVVADSEDEEDDEEMLFDTSTSLNPGPAVQASITLPQPPTEPTKQQEEPSGKVKFILIDNLAQVLSPILKKDYIQGNALASTFLQSLAHLTRTHSLFTILAVPATVPPLRQPVVNAPPEQNKLLPPPPPSVFAGNALVPSLAHVLSRYADVGLMVSSMPKGKMDARVFYREGGGDGVVKKLRGVEMVRVVEVVWDRWGDGTGAWGVWT